MKINIDPSALETVKALRGELAMHLASITKSTGDLDRLTGDKTKLQEEIARLEGNPSLNDANAQKLAGKREQLKQIENKIEELSTIDGEATDSQQRIISTLLREFSRQAAAATGPGITAYCKEIAEKIRPWCNSDEVAMALAYQIPAAKSLISNYAWAFGTSLISVMELKRAIARADEILSGELNWTWDAKI